LVAGHSNIVETSAIIALIHGDVVDCVRAECRGAKCDWLGCHAVHERVDAELEVVFRSAQLWLSLINAGLLS